MARGNQEKSCVITLGGNIIYQEALRRRLAVADGVWCADSGARHLLDLGILPQLVVGDLDSLDDDLRAMLLAAGCGFLRAAAEKNDTDSSLAIKEAMARGYGKIYLWGALGGRADHSYANIALLQLGLQPEHLSAYYAGKEPKDRLAAKGGSCTQAQVEAIRPEIFLEDGGLRIFLPKRGQWLHGQVGDYLSFFALTPEVTGFRHRGLKYQPTGGRYESSFPLGVSNEFLQEDVYFTWDEGVLLCMQVANDRP